jgi:hypothetical protein
MIDGEDEWIIGLFVGIIPAEMGVAGIFLDCSFAPMAISIHSNANNSNWSSRELELVPLENPTNWSKRRIPIFYDMKKI